MEADSRNLYLLSQGKDVARKECPMGFGKASVVLVVNTEADTDPELYRRILSGDA